MLSIPGTEALSPAVKYVIAFAIIFVLLALFALVLRRLTGGRLSLPSSDRGRSRQPRLGIVDVYDLDRQRQLILLRRDNVEHLLLIGGPNDVIVETNIVRTPGARLPPSTIEQAERAEPLIDRSLEAQPRPYLDPAQRPEPVVARLGPADPVRAGADPTGRNGQAAFPPEPVLKPDLVALSAAPAPAPVPRPAPQPVRDVAPPQPMREPPPPVREPPPQYYREPSPPPPAREPPPPPPVQRVAPAKAPPPPREAFPAPAPEPPALRAAPEPPRQPAPAPARQAEATVGDAAVLSNMAKQLEEALKRPLPAGKTGSSPAPAPAPNGPALQAEERQPRGTPAPVGRVQQPAPAPAPIPMLPPSARQPEPQEAPAPRPRPAPAPVSRMRTAPEPEPAKAKQAAATPQPAPTSGESDPFSVEEIEAEFARLLGRPLDPSERPH